MGCVRSKKREDVALDSIVLEDFEPLDPVDIEPAVSSAPAERDDSDSITSDDDDGFLADG